MPFAQPAAAEAETFMATIRRARLSARACAQPPVFGVAGQALFPRLAR